MNIIKYRKMEEERSSSSKYIFHKIKKIYLKDIYIIFIIFNYFVYIKILDLLLQYLFI